MANLVRRQGQYRGRVVVGHPRIGNHRLAVAGEIPGAINSYDARVRFRPFDIDPDNARVRSVAALEGHMQDAIGTAVGSVLPAAGQQPGILGAQDPRSHVAWMGEIRGAREILFRHGTWVPLHMVM